MAQTSTTGVALPSPTAIASWGPRLFPPSFNIYIPCFGWDQGQRWIGEHKQPRLWALSFCSPYQNLEIDPHMFTLHSTPREPDDKTPHPWPAPLLVGQYWAAPDKFMITFDDPSPGGIGRGTEWVDGADAYRFSVVVPAAPENPRPEADSFEWRVTAERFIPAAIAKSMRPRVPLVLVLVRLTGHHNGKGAEGRRASALYDLDGSEVLAAWCWNNKFVKDYSFRFLGSAAAGELGPRLELMAVASGLCCIAMFRRKFFASGRPSGERRTLSDIE